MTISQDDLIRHLRDDMNIDEPIQGDTELFSTGLLDSVSMVSLITFIEEKTGATIPAGDVTLENFDTVERIVAYVASLG